MGMAKYIDREAYVTKHTKFCPNCGAKMDEVIE